MALMHELVDKPENLEQALKIWNDLKTQQGCERTVQILRNLGRKSFVVKYSNWVFEMNPDIGLKLFTEGRGKTIMDDTAFRPNP